MQRSNAETVRLFTKIFKTEHDVDGIDHLFTGDFTHNFRIPLAPGLAGFKEIGRMMNAAFPDVRVTEEALFAAGDHVIERSSAVATHGGDFMGLASTGKKVRWTEIHIYRLRDAQIAEHWVELSTAELVDQIRPATLSSTHEIGIRATPERVFDLLATAEGLRSWWTDSVCANAHVGHVNTFGFDGGAVEMPFRVDTSDRPVAIAWTCVEGERVPQEWLGTRITATLQAGMDGTTRLQFAHEGWRPGAQNFALCNSTWGELMHRLRDSAELRHPGPHFSSSVQALDGRRLVRDLYARLMSQGDADAGRALLAEDYVDHNIPGLGSGGRDALIAAVLAVRSAFPDIRPVICETVLEGALVAVRVVARGHHTGSDFMNMPASGTAIEWNELHVFRHAGGQIREHWGVFDLLAILEQLKAASQ